MKTGTANAILRISALAMISLFFACSPLQTDKESLPPDEMGDIDVPAGFPFELRRQYDLVINIRDIDHAPYTSLPVRVLDPDEDLLVEGVTDADGRFRATIILAQGQDEVFIEAPAIGIVESKRLIQLTSNPCEITID